jgi:hypothetical protein
MNIDNSGLFEPTFKDLKVGDTVYFAHSYSYTSATHKALPIKVTKVGRKYITTDYRKSRFLIEGDGDFRRLLDTAFQGIVWLSLDKMNAAKKSHEMRSDIIRFCLNGNLSNLKETDIEEVHSIFSRYF